MNLSLNWLRDFVKIPKSISTNDLALKLTMHTVEIDSVNNQKEIFDKVVVGKLLEVKKHPNADKLQLASVDVGSEKLSIVCGAPNIQAGQLVPVALVGAVLSNSMEIKKVKVRGESSVGMLCAEDELGLGSDHSGIVILKDDAKVGMDFSDYLKLDDVVYEVDNKSITHRPDLWSHYGIAREIAAFLKTDFEEYKSNLNKLKIDKKDSIDVKVSDTNLCPRYMAVVVDGIKIAKSPEWMEKRLIAAGMRPINNIVDVTNYVMLEFGQPLHAFDRNLVDKIVVRRAKKNEVLETLDGEKRELEDDMLLIADSTKPLAVAGVMGGASSEINDKTETIIIEAANFDFLSVRKTCQKLGLRTESSIRFEKSLDPNLCEFGLARAIELIRELSPGAKVISEISDKKNFKLDQEPIEIKYEWLNSILGQNIDKSDINSILSRLGFETKEKNAGIMVKAPSWRATRDISTKEDVVEEIARIYGYDNFAESMPKVGIKANKIQNPHKFEYDIKQRLTGISGFSEVKNYSFVGEEQLRKLGIDYSSHIRLANPISTAQTMLRQSLAPNMFTNIKNNQTRYSEIALFEIGNIFLSIAGNYATSLGSEDYLPHQEKRLGMIAASDKAENAFNRAKGAVKSLLKSYYLNCDFETTETLPSWADKNRSARIVCEKNELGFVSALDKKIAQSNGIKKESVFISVSLNELDKLLVAYGQVKFREFEKFPPVVRDLAFVVDNKILYKKIRDEILGFDKLIYSVDLFDVYSGDNIGKNNKSLAFHINYRADRTLTSEEVDKIQNKLIKLLEEKFDAKIRDF